MILVTGGTGLVGYHLLLQLSLEKEAIRAIYRSEKKLQHVKNLFQTANQLVAFEKINWVQADILDVPALELAFTDVSLVYHCAALVSFNPKDEDKLYQNNIVGTANVVNISLSKNVKKMCYVSSISALGNGTEHNLILNEETERNSEAIRSDYSISKFGAEMEVWRGFQEGLDVVIVNPGVIFGNGFPKEGSSLFIQNIKDGQSFYTLGKLGIVAVEDVVKALTTLMKSTISGERYILVAEDVTYKELFESIAEILNNPEVSGQNYKRIKKPKYLVKKWQTQVARVLEFIFATLFFRKRMLTQSTINSLYNLEIHDTSKIKNAIDFEFLDMKVYLKTLVEKKDKAYNNDKVKNYINEVKLVIDKMISKSIEQSIQDYEFLYSIKDIIEELEQNISEKNEIDSNFRKKWNLMIGKSFRAFEGTKLEKLLDLIEIEIKKMT